MEKRELTCIGCPMGCTLTVKMDNGQILNVSGFTCPRGEKYARKEITAPTRIVTGSVRVRGSRTGAATVSCKTASDIPKQMIFDVTNGLKGVCVPCPVRIGDVLIRDIAGTGADIVATKNVD